MNYVAFFGILIPFQICFIVTCVAIVRRKTIPDQPAPWLQLLWKVLLLSLVVNALAIFPVVAYAALVLWLVVLKRLSGLDVLGTVLFSSTLGVINFAATILLARYFQVSLAGQQMGG